MNYTKEIRKAVRMEKLQRKNRHFADILTSHMDNIQGVIDRTAGITPNDDGDILTERQRSIAGKLLESGNCKGYALFDDDYNHLCKNLLSKIIFIDSIEVVAVQYSCCFYFSFIEKEVLTNKQL